MHRFLFFFLVLLPYHVHASRTKDNVDNIELHYGFPRCSSSSPSRNTSTIDDIRPPFPHFPGTFMMQYGYNFITDQVALSHTEILDTMSSSKYNFEMMYKGQCYIVPDAFLTEQSIGVLMHSYTSNKVEVLAGESSGYYRVKKQMKHNNEFDGRLNMTPEDLAKAMFSQSSDVIMLNKATKQHSYDTSSNVYTRTIYDLQVKRAIPSLRITHLWRKLYQQVKKTRDPDERMALFRDYFDMHGTHYFTSGSVGGDWLTGFTLDQSSTSTLDSNADTRAECLGMKLLSTYLNNFNAKLKVCRNVLMQEKVRSSFSELVQQSWSICHGAGHFCPAGPGNDENPVQALKAWNDAIEKEPVIIGGKKNWITSLLKHVITFVDYDNDPAYKEILTLFGGKLHELKDFTELMETHLRLYILEHQYCTLYPTDPWCGNCNERCVSGIATGYYPKEDLCYCVDVTEKMCKWDGWVFKRCVPQEYCYVVHREVLFDIGVPEMYCIPKESVYPGVQ